MRPPTLALPHKGGGNQKAFPSKTLSLIKRYQASAHPTRMQRQPLNGSTVTDSPMVKPDGKATMLGHWRISLRQAEEAAKSGRYDEAIALTARPELAGHHHAIALRGKMALDLIARGTRRAEADDVPGAVDDFRLAEALGAGPDTLAAARLHVADRVAGEVRSDLELGEPGRVLERIDELSRLKIGGPALRRTREVADAWRIALDEARRGEFGRAYEALDRAERFAAGSPPAALEATRRDLGARQAAAHPRVEALYAALEAARWPEVLAAADLVLETIPEHPAARQARSKAWQQIGAIAPSASAGWPIRAPKIVPTGLGLDPEPAPVASPPRMRIEPEPKPGPAQPSRALAQAGQPGPKGRFLLWVDAVGGFLVCLDETIILGRAGADSNADVPLLGDLARNHATISRDGEGYLIRAVKPTFVNGQEIETAPLRDGDVIRLGTSVELEFRQPSPVSATARLQVVSRHRLPLAVDAVILMAETCIIGPSSQAHITAANVDGPIVLYRQGAGLACRAPGAFEVDGRTCAARAPITLQSSVFGEGFSFSLEPLGSRSSPC
jgi:hypothetical protein